MIEELRKLDVEVVTECVQARLAVLQLQSSLLDWIKEVQKSDSERVVLEKVIKEATRTEMWKDDQGIIRFGTRLWVPASGDLRKEVLSEAHSSAYSVHPGSTKMYKDLKKHFWWNNLKRDVASHVAKCLVCQQVKIKHQRPGGELQPLAVP